MSKHTAALDIFASSYFSHNVIINVRSWASFLKLSLALESMTELLREIYLRFSAITLFLVMNFSNEAAVMPGEYARFKIAGETFRFFDGRSSFG